MICYVFFLIIIYMIQLWHITLSIIKVFYTLFLFCPINNLMLHKNPELIIEIYVVISKLFSDKKEFILPCS